MVFVLFVDDCLGHNVCHLRQSTVPQNLQALQVLFIMSLVQVHIAVFD